MTRHERFDVVVAGAGITGLVTALGLRRAGLRVAVLEATARAGGVIATTRHRGFVAEHGPNSLLRNAALDRLVQWLGLADELVVAGAAGRRRYVARDGAAHPLPASPLEFLRTPLLSPLGKLRLLQEPWIRPSAHAGESVASFVRRRFGPEVLDRLANPFVAGVFAGDPERLGIAHAFPTLHALERDHGSVLRGARARRRAGAVSGTPRGIAETVSFRAGLETLPQSLARHLGGALQLETPLRAARRTDDGWRLAVGALGATRSIDARALVWTAPAHALGSVEWPDTGRMAVETIASMEHPPVAALTLGFRREQVRHALDGFGVLVPESEPFGILGALFSSSLFPGRAPDGHVTITCFLGGARRPELGAASVDAVQAIALADLARLLGVQGAPAWRHHVSWPRAIPQYDVEHGRVRAAASALERGYPGLFVVGQALEGIALGDCIAAGERAAERVGSWIGQPAISQDETLAGASFAPPVPGAAPHRAAAGRPDATPLPRG